MITLWTGVSTALIFVSLSRTIDIRKHHRAKTFIETQVSIYTTWPKLCGHPNLVIVEPTAMTFLLSGSPRFWILAAWICSCSAPSALVDWPLMLCSEAWLSVCILIHPWGFVLGWGQDPMQASQRLPHHNKLRKQLLCLTSRELLCWNIKRHVQNCCHKS